MPAQRRSHSGYTLVILLVVIATIVIGGLMYRQHQRSEKQRQAQAQKDLAQRAEVAEQAQLVDRERKALEERQAADRQQRDTLAMAYKAMDAIVAKWDDAASVAGATSRIALAAPVATLQAIRREAEAVVVPPCLDDGKAHLLKSMASTIEAYMAFMRNELKLGEVLATGYLTEAKQARDDYIRGRDACPH